MDGAQVHFTLSEDFKAGFDRFARATGKDMKTILMEGARILSEKAYLYTPPPQRGNRGKRGGKIGGRMAIFEDVMDTMEPRSPGYLAFLVTKFGTEISDKTLRRKSDGKLYTVRNVTVNASGDIGQAIRYHNRQRRKYDGRVPNSQRDRDLVQNRMMLPNEAQQELATASPSADSKAGQLQKRVGMLKAGWMPALKFTKSTKYPDKWSAAAGAMEPRSGKPKGRYRDNLMPEIMKGYFEAGNSTPYMRDSEGFMRRVTKEVEDYFGKGGDRLEKWFDEMIKKHSRYGAVKTGVGSRLPR